MAAADAAATSTAAGCWPLPRHAATRHQFCNSATFLASGSGGSMAPVVSVPIARTAGGEVEGLPAMSQNMLKRNGSMVSSRKYVREHSATERACLKFKSHVLRTIVSYIAP